jgi:UDP-2-acetamido-3-amino-2,3-dideoxy-glucuronate N-acetyltransferase
MVGNPARHKGWMSKMGHKLEFNNQGIAQCPESKEQYELKNEIVTCISDQK